MLAHAAKSVVKEDLDSQPPVMPEIIYSLVDMHLQSQRMALEVRKRTETP
jgi:hypothetical protein